MKKIRLYQLTGRRNFRPLIALLYLTFPESNLIDLGRLISIGSLTSFLIEIPTGYISDRMGYKTTLIIGKVAMVGSTISFIVGDSFLRFAIANILFNVALAFKSGTLQAFVHDTLESKKQGDTYGSVMSAMSGEVSLVSVVFILGYPLLYSVDPYLPFWIALGVDIVGLATSVLLVNPTTSNHLGDEKKAYRSMGSIIKEFFKTPRLVYLSLIVSFIRVFFLSQALVKEPYVTSIGFPIALIGLIMGGSRLVRFLIAKWIARIKGTIPVLKLVAIDVTILTIAFIIASMSFLPWYIIGGVLIILTGYYFARSPLYTHKLLDYLPDRSYKATFLSIQGQMNALFAAFIPGLIGLVMGYSFSYGFLLIGILIGLAGSIGWLFLRKKIKDDHL